ncbi:26S proteasome regulatory subunit 4-like [Vitis vinifera]|uniref:26S proteasome regulatory subunit 4-like n=1 Tax=Vitis vinifera TaxID=29760 RepID=A0A438H597_VITVI|nr:26S proteasome regulatory subunit 4-like [Vitis vinifera]
MLQHKSFFLEWWNPSVGCLKEDRDECEVWVVVGTSVFAVQLWWEIPSWWSKVEPPLSYSDWGAGEEGEVGSHAREMETDKSSMPLPKANRMGIAANPGPMGQTIEAVGLSNGPCLSLCPLEERGTRRPTFVALLNEAVGFQGKSSLVLSSSSAGPSALDGRLFDLTGNEEKGPSSKEVVGKVEKMKVKKALKVGGWSEGEEFCSAIIPSTFSEFSSFLGLLAAVVAKNLKLSSLFKVEWLKSVISNAYLNLAYSIQNDSHLLAQFEGFIGTDLPPCKVAAVANSTSATFLRVVGSELIQKYLGDGPKLVRELFRVADDLSPSIVFIDEIDAVGTKRYDAHSGGEREIQRTMLELLNQLDGFDSRGDVKVILATNRIESLDPALLRPGRIDRKIEFPLPDIKTRRRIFQIHTSRMTLADDVNLEEFVMTKDEFSGADIKAICTEAGLLALRERRMKVRLALLFPLIARKEISLSNDCSPRTRIPIKFDWLNTVLQVTHVDFKKAKEKVMFKKKEGVPEGLYM